MSEGMLEGWELLAVVLLTVVAVLGLIAWAEWKRPRR